MPVNNYLRECKYNLNNLDNYIYLYEFNEPLLDYITDDEESNASASDIKGSAQRLYCESVTYSSTSSVDNRFSFDNTLTVTLAEHSKVSHYSIIQTLLNNNWMVVFKNKEDEAFVVNAEYPVMVSYSYVINDEKTPNILTITFRALQNVPTINLKTSVAFSSTLCDKPCEYVISRIKSLKMIDMNKATIDVNNNGFTLDEKGEGNLKTIEFNPMSMSFTDSYDGREFSQTLSFQIPFEMYRFYFHYNLLEYLDNRYYALIKTTNDNNILGGFRQGLFPSYTVSTSDSGNLITINLNAKYASYSVLGSDTMNITTSDGIFYKPVLGECVNKLFTWTLIEQYNANGVATNGYYCLNGFEEIYSDYTILGTYTQFETNFGFKLTDFNIDCYEGCKINNLPSSIQFQTSGETQCFVIDTNCSVTWEWNAEAIDFTYDEITKEMCVTSKVDEGTFNIKATSSDGTIQYVTVVIGSGGITGDTTTTINITAEGQKVSVIPVKGLNNVKSITSSLQYQTNQNGNGYEVTVPENTNEESRTFTITIIYKDNSIETINIIQGRIYYVITSSEDTECFGNDLYYVNKKYKKYTEYGELIFMENIKGNQKETDSVNCMDYDEKVSGCTSCFEGYIYTLYEYKKDGTTIATRYEKTSSSCTDNASTEYIVNTEKAVCVDGTEYYVEELFGANCNGGDNVKLYPVIERASNTEATDSNVCDTINPNISGSTLYRWVDTNETYCLTDGNETNCTSSTTETYCDGYNLYEKTTYYVDAICNGNWVTSGSPTNRLIERNSTRCGYTGTTCTSSMTNNNYTMLAIGVNDMNGNGLGGFAADGDDIINTELTVAWNESIIIDECSYTYDTVVINTDCSSSTTQNTGTTFTTSISSTENESTEYRETVTITIKTGATTIGYVTFYRDAKPSEPVAYCDTLSFEFTGSSVTYSLYQGSGSRKRFTATTSPYNVTMSDLGITDIKDYSFSQSDVTKINSLFQTENTIQISFTDCTKLNSINLSCLNTSNFTDMGSMFNGCSGLTSLDVSKFNTSNVTDMGAMFENCSGLTSLDVSNFNTNNVTSMVSMFHNCKSLTSLDLSNFNTNNVTNMTQMFFNCSGLTSLDVSSFNTSNVTEMGNMFYNCNSLTSLDLSGWSTSNVTNMNAIFYGCLSLQTLNLSGWDMSKVKTTSFDSKYYRPFTDCNNLTIIYAYGCNTSTINLLNTYKPSNCTLVY